MYSSSSALLPILFIFLPFQNQDFLRIWCVRFQFVYVCVGGERGGLSDIYLITQFYTYDFITCFITQIYDFELYL